MTIKKKFFFLLVFLTSGMLISQDLESKIYTQFDNLLGLESTSIFNGKRYFEKYRFFENNHPYYFTSNFENGDVTIDNQNYYNVKIKYNLIEDNLILSLNQENNFLALTLTKEKVNKFKLNNSVFVNSTFLKNQIEDLGYFEEILSGSSILYKKHYKIINTEIRKNNIYNNFKSNFSFWLNTSSGLKEITNQKSIIKIFPSQKNKIKQFFKINKNLYKEKPTQFYKNLIQNIDTTF